MQTGYDCQTNLESVSLLPVIQTVELALVAREHVAVFLVGAGLIGDGAAGLASGLAGCLAFAAATVGQRVLQAGLLDEIGRPWQSRIVREIERCEQTVALIGHFAQELAIAAGDRNENAGGAVRAQFYFAVDQPFRQWLQAIDPERDDPDEAALRWQAQARSIAEKLGVTKPSVVRIMNLLMERGMIVKEHYGKIYLMLGINELGTGTAESWAAQYKVLLDEIRELQPDAIIFLQAIFHTTQEKSDATFFKNSTIDARNAELQKLADNETVFYIDCNPVFDDDTGALTPEYSGDGVHVKAPYYPMWRDYLFQFGVVRDKSSDAPAA